MAGNGASRDPLLALALADPAREPDAVRPWVRLAPAADSLCPPDRTRFSVHACEVYTGTIPQEDTPRQSWFFTEFSGLSSGFLPLCIGKVRFPRTVFRSPGPFGISCILFGKKHQIPSNNCKRGKHLLYWKGSPRRATAVPGAALRENRESRANRERYRRCKRKGTEPRRMSAIGEP